MLILDNLSPPSCLYILPCNQNPARRSILGTIYQKSIRPAIETAEIKIRTAEKLSNPAKVPGTLSAARGSGARRFSGDPAGRRFSGDPNRPTGGRAGQNEARGVLVPGVFPGIRRGSGARRFSGDPAGVFPGIPAAQRGKKRVKARQIALGAPASSRQGTRGRRPPASMRGLHPRAGWKPAWFWCRAFFRAFFRGCESAGRFCVEPGRLRSGDSGAARTSRPGGGGRSAAAGTALRTPSEFSVGGPGGAADP